MLKKADQDQFNELLFYTLGHTDIEGFIHQHAVDAYTAQKADEYTKPISLIFSLVGLHLYIDKNYSGREVQKVHIKMSKNKKAWPAITLPEHRGGITVTDVLAASPGHERDLMIKKWCRSVWEAYKDNHDIVAALAKNEWGNMDSKKLKA